MLMNMSNGWASVIVLLAASMAQGSILPKNDLHLQDSLFVESGITEEEFNEAIDEAEEYYRPIIESKGASFTINRKWNDSTVNASAQQMFGSWIVNMYGGLARRPEVTKDGFALVLCHELGHHLGGFPFVSSWAANEGQSDYFATQSCARILWKDELEKNAEAAELIPETPKAACDAGWDTESDRNLCYRTILAGKSLADLLGALRGDEPSYDTPDTSVVESTYNRHPAAQCRLDTYVAGALCNIDFDPELIPGKSTGRSSPEAEREAMDVSCSRALRIMQGVRPLCWFKPRLEEETPEDDQ